MSKVSVIMPAYNAAKHIGESIESVIAQTYPDWELIIVDDGSTDNTKEVVDAYIKHEPRISYTYQQNGRQGKARNNGIRQAKGEYIAFLDSDDLWLNNKLEKQLEVFATTDVDLVFSDSYIFSDSFLESSSTVMKTARAKFEGMEGVLKFLEGNWVPILTATCKRTVLTEAGGFTEEKSLQNAEDYHLWLKLQLAGYKFIGIDETLAAYRKHPNSVSNEDGSNYKQFIEAQIDLYNKYEDYRAIIRPYLLNHIRYNFKFLDSYSEDEFYTTVRKYIRFMQNPIIKFLLSTLLIFKNRGTILSLMKVAFQPAPIIRNPVQNIKFKIEELLKTKRGKYFHNFYFKHINFHSKSQIKNYKKIPIIINNFNQYENLLRLLDFLKSRGYNNIYIVDNNSTYPPLLAFYKKTDVNIFMLGENIGHLAFWKRREIYDRFKGGYYVVTDPDVLPSESCPDDFLKYFAKVLVNNYYVLKVGCALKVSDIPDSYPLKQSVLNWEKQFWEYKLFPDGYLAQIDTTFALYRPYSGSYVNTLGFFDGIRIGGNYEARHGGWYINPSNPTPEEKFYMETANNSSSWILDSKMNHRESTEKYINDPSKVVPAEIKVNA